MSSIYDFSCLTMQGKELALSSLKGKVVLVVNTASQCGFTPQLKGLESLYKQYQEDGLEVLGFPCNQFGKQDPGSNDEISDFCTLNYGVTFPVFQKIEVNGADAHPLYRYLKQEKPGLLGSTGIKWNFTKFLINSEGKVVKRFAPKDSPKKIESAVKALLVQGDTAK